MMKNPWHFTRPTAPGRLGTYTRGGTDGVLFFVLDDIFDALGIARGTDPAGVVPVREVVWDQRSPDDGSFRSAPTNFVSEAGALAIARDHDADYADWLTTTVIPARRNKTPWMIQRIAQDRDTVQLTRHRNGDQHELRVFIGQDGAASVALADIAEACGVSEARICNTTGAGDWYLTGGTGVRHDDHGYPLLTVPEAALAAVMGLHCARDYYTWLVQEVLPAARRDFVASRTAPTAPPVTATPPEQGTGDHLAPGDEPTLHLGGATVPVVPVNLRDPAPGSAAPSGPATDPRGQATFTPRGPGTTGPVTDPRGQATFTPRGPGYPPTSTPLPGESVAVLDSVIHALTGLRAAASAARPRTTTTEQAVPGQPTFRPMHEHHTGPTALRGRVSQPYQPQPPRA